MKSKESPSYYSILTADVRYDNNLTSSQKLFYSEITALSNKYGYCWSSNSYFAKLYGVQNSTISNWIKGLKENGHIKVEYIMNGKEIVGRRIYPVQKNKTEGINQNDYPIQYNEHPIQYIDGGYSIYQKDNTTRSNIINSNTTRSNNTENQVFGYFSDSENNDSDLSSLKSIPKKEKKETGAQKKEKEVISEVMDYLNEKIERNLRKDSTAARQIWHRYKDGATVEEMKRVIDDKVKEWIDGEMKKYLHPSTLFLKRNYEKYVEQLPPEPETNYDQFFEKVKPEIDNQIKDSKLLMIWDEKQNTSLISIYKKIKDLMIENGEDPKISAATEMICWVIKSLDDFHRNNFSIDYLDRNFIKILNQVKNEKDNKRNKGIDSIREFSRALGEELGI